MNALQLWLVKAGDVLSAKSWQMMERAVTMIQLFSGYGISLRKTADGTIISVDAQAVAWDHPFKVDLSGPRGCTITFGTVNGKVPQIKGVPMDGGDKNLPVPAFEWEETRLDKEGRGWIAVEVHFDEGWFIDNAYFVQVASLETDDGSEGGDLTKTAMAVGTAPTLSGNRTRWPIAMLKRRGNGQLEIFQQVHHTLQHRMKQNARGVPRHFFYL